MVLTSPAPLASRIDRAELHPVRQHQPIADRDEIGVPTKDDLDRGQRNELLGVRNIPRREDVPVGQEGRRPDECLSQRITPFEVVGEREFEHVLTLGGDCRRALGRIRKLTLPGREHRDSLEEVSVLHRREHRIGLETFRELPKIISPKCNIRVENEHCIRKELQRGKIYRAGKAQVFRMTMQRNPFREAGDGSGVPFGSMSPNHDENSYPLTPLSAAFGCIVKSPKNGGSAM